MKGPATICFLPTLGETKVGRQLNGGIYKAFRLSVGTEDGYRQHAKGEYLGHTILRYQTNLFPFDIMLQGPIRGA